MYDHPTNLFVAGFIGSPAMNMVNGELHRGGTNGGAEVAFGGIALPVPDVLFERRPGLKEYVGKRIIVGIRPEDMEHPDFVADRRHGSTMDVVVDVREAMGAEVYAHFTVDEPPVVTDATVDLAADAGELENLPASDGEARSGFVARLNSRAPAEEGKTMPLWVDMRALHAFDPDSGHAIV
jgi:multiple sugar transport system ATP-binding protein